MKVLDMSGSRHAGNDVQFLNQCWIWFPNNNSSLKEGDSVAECIDGETGLIYTTGTKTDSLTSEKEIIRYSNSCTYSFATEFLHFLNKMDHIKLNVLVNLIGKAQMKQFLEVDGSCEMTLASLRQIKATLSPQHENVKDLLLHKNAVFRHWRRRSK